MNPVDCLLRLLEAVSEEDAEKRHAAADLLGWLESGGFLPLASSGEHSVTIHERRERLQRSLRRIARRFADQGEPLGPRHEPLACANEMNRVTEELCGCGLIDLADDLRLQARAGLAALAATKPE